MTRIHWIACRSTSQGSIYRNRKQYRMDWVVMLGILQTQPKKLICLRRHNHNYWQLTTKQNFKLHMFRKNNRKPDQERHDIRRFLQLQTAAYRVLRDVGIACSNISFIDFNTAKWNSNDKTLHTVLCSMLANRDQETLRKVPTFRQVVLSPGSYCFPSVAGTRSAALCIIFKKRFQDPPSLL